MGSNSWEDELTCTWRGEGQLDITGFPEDMPMCLQYYLSSIKSEKWPRALHLIQEGEGHCFLSGTGISFPRDYESSSSDEDGPSRGRLPEDEVEFFAGRFPKNRLKRLVFLRIVKKCLSERSETYGPIDGERQFLDYLEEEERRSKLATELVEPGSTSTDVEVQSSQSQIADESNFVTKTEKGQALTSNIDIQDLITNNYDLLLENINVQKVIPHMIHKRVLERSDADEIGVIILGSARGRVQRESSQGEALLDMISRRRSCSVALFRDILRIEHPDVVDRLSTKASSPKAIISRQKGDTGPFYRMTHKPRGTALIIIDTDTYASKEDSELLAGAFKSLNFAPKIVRDIGLTSTYQPGGTVDQDFNIVCWLSERSHRVSHVLDRYTYRNDMPTLFFFHLYPRRPYELDLELEMLERRRFMYHHHRYKMDYYISLSSSPNYCRTLAKVLMEYGKTDDFVSMMSKVYSACDNFHCHNGLRKRLYFPP